MKKYLFLFFILTSLYGFAQRASQNVEEWTGTGFVLCDNYIVTNYHVIKGAEKITIQGVNGNFNSKYIAEVIATDKNNDLAILKLKGGSVPSINIPYSIKTTTSDVGEEVFVLGYPLTSTMGEEIKLTTGVISSKTGFQGDVSIYQISAPIQPGNSGGPLFDSKGNIIGIVSAKHQGAENVGYAIKTSYLRNLMESAISSNVLPQNNKIASLNLSGKVRAVKNYVYYIVCSKSTMTATPNTNNNAIRSDNPSKITGYRIQVYCGKDKERAMKIGYELKNLFPDGKVYVHFYNPNWTCRIGDYLTFEEAKYMRDKIANKGYPDIHIIIGPIKSK